MDDQKKCTNSLNYEAEFEHMRGLYHKTLDELNYYKNMETELVRLRAQMDVVYLIFGGK